MRQRSVTILGATGSIGLSSMKVIELHSELFKIFALTAHSQKEKLFELCLKYQPRFAVLSYPEDADWLRAKLGDNSVTTVLAGVDSTSFVASQDEVDIVIAAIMGAAGAVPTFAAAKAGKRILLANKETLVLAGDLFYQTVKQSGATVLPVDSEHNAIFQVIPKEKKDIKQIILTASGGALLRTELSELPKVRVEQALKHPTWKMGRKISIDSATMMNKALEVIEAFWLFDLPANKIDVIIHPESIIHSMVRLIDESVLAQLGVADMCIPIEYCLAYPDRVRSGASALDFTEISQMSFIKVDKCRFPALDLAYQCLQQGLDAGCILNAANEVAVELFLQKKIKFTDIYALIVEALNSFELESQDNLDSLLLKDGMVRQKTRELAAKIF